MRTFVSTTERCKSEFGFSITFASVVGVAQVVRIVVIYVLENKLGVGGCHLSCTSFLAHALGLIISTFDTGGFLSPGAFIEFESI